MDPPQLLAFFERATDSSLHLTKESLEKIVKNVDEDGDGLVRTMGGDRVEGDWNRYFSRLVRLDYVHFVFVGGRSTESAVDVLGRLEAMRASIAVRQDRP